MSWKRWIGAGIMVSLLAVSLTGCWDDETVTQRATAFVLSIMPAPHRQFRFTFFFPNPAESISTNENIPAQSPFQTTQVVAGSLSVANDRAQRELARDLFMGQLQDIIVSRDIPAGSIGRLVKEYNRDGYVSHTVFLVAEPTGTNPVPVTIQEPVPSVYFTQYFNCKTCQPAYLGQPLWRVWDAFVTPGISPVIPYASPLTRVARILVYPSRGRPWLMNRAESRGWALMMNHAFKETFQFPMDGGPLVIKRLRARTQVYLRYHAGKLIANGHINAYGSLIEWPSSFLDTPHHVSVAESMTSQEIIAECLAAVHFANKTKTDPFGWGRNYLYAHPGESLQYAGQRGMLGPLHAHLTVTTHLTTSGVSE